MKRAIEASVDWNYFDQFDPILDAYLPPRGEGRTLATQFTTATNALIYGWYNNGDVYDTKTIDGGPNDLSSYANWLAKHDDQCKTILDKISNVKRYGDYEDILKELADYVWYQKDFTDLPDTPKDGSIYDTEGEYTWSDTDAQSDVEENYELDRDNYEYICKNCLKQFEHDKGPQKYSIIDVDPNNKAESECDWCEKSGFDTLYEIEQPDDLKNFDQNFENDDEPEYEYGFDDEYGI